MIAKAGTYEAGSEEALGWNNFTWAAFERRMRELGYIEGQNFAVEFINAKDHVERIGEAARDLSRRKVDIGLADSHLTLKSIAAAMSTSPIVFIASNFDPVALGFVASIARRAATSPAFTSAGRNWSKSRSEYSLSLFRERLGWLCFGMSLWPKASRPPSGQLLRCI